MEREEEETPKGVTQCNAAEVEKWWEIYVGVGLDLGLGRFKITRNCHS